MSQAYAVRPDGHTRWGRFLIAFLLPMAAVVVIAGSLASGILAATISVGGLPIHLKLPELQGTGLGAFGNAAPSLGGDKQVATAGIADATINGGLCAAIEVPMPIVGGFTIRFVSPADNPLTAKTMVLDVTQLSGDLDATNIVIGRDASALTEGPARGPGGSNGIQAERMTLSNVEGTAYSLSAGSLKVNGVNIDLASKEAGC